MPLFTHGVHSARPFHGFALRLCRQSFQTAFYIHMPRQRSVRVLLRPFTIIHHARRHSEVSRTEQSRAASGRGAGRKNGPRLPMQSPGHAGEQPKMRASCGKRAKRQRVRFIASADPARSDAMHLTVYFGPAAIGETSRIDRQIDLGFAVLPPWHRIPALRRN